MNYITDIGMWNGGRGDQWNTARSPGMGMAYFTRADMPYYHALADTFTIGDQYFQSTFTQTNPNRLHHFSGSNGLSVNQTPFLDNSEPNPGHTWPTMAEVLEGTIKARTPLQPACSQSGQNTLPYTRPLPPPSPRCWHLLEDLSTRG